MRADRANHDAILQAVETTKPDLVLVDYFDTVVTRRSTPRGVELAAARHLAERYRLGCGVDGVHRARRRAERQIESELVAAGSDPEYRLDEVAARMWELLSSADGADEFVTAVTEISLAVERSAQMVDEQVVGALREVASERPLVLVSDFYFPGELFRRMLAERGLDELFGEVVVSCDARLSKASGRLYPQVLGSVGHLIEGNGTGPIEGGRVLMIGDNPVSDIAKATEHGLSAVQVERPSAGRGAAAVQRARRRLGEGLAGSWPERHRAVGRVLDAAGSPPFGELAVTLFMFTRMLHDQARREGFGQLLFLAREGQFLRELFEIYQGLHPAGAGAGARVGSQYLVVSRRATLLASLAPLDDESFEAILSDFPGLSLANLIGSLGFGLDLAERVGRELGVGPDEPADPALLRKSDEFRRCYEPARQDQSTFLRRYVEQVAGSLDAPLCVVDVGFRGTMQDSLQRVLGREVSGMYLGITSEGPLAADERKQAVLFDSRRPVSPAYRVLRHFKLLYELLLQADHGSAARYVEQGGEPVPVLDTQDAETEDFERHVRPLQDRLREVFAELCRLDGCRNTPLLATVAETASVHSRMLFFPRRDEVDLVRSLRHYENYGVMGMVDAGSSRISGRRRLRAIAALAVKPTRILAVGWPPSALTELGLRPLIPVVGAYRAARELGLPAVRATTARLSPGRKS